MGGRAFWAVEQLGTALACLILLAGCSQPHRVATAPGASSAATTEAPAANPHGRSKAAPPPDDIVARSARSFEVVRMRDSARIDRAELFSELGRYDVVCLGEDHDDPRQHFGELEILQGLSRRAVARGRRLGLGLEMFQTPFSGPLRAFARGDIGLDELRTKTEYDSRWGFPFAYYRPLLVFARNSGLALVALNAPQELTHAVATRGLIGLSTNERRHLPELDLDDAAHRAEFDRAMADHPAKPAKLDDFYAAQVLWDETMADTAARWLAARAPLRTLVIVAGSAHCRDGAIPNRLRRRTPASIASVLLSAGAAADTSGFSHVLTLAED